MQTRVRDSNATTPEFKLSAKPSLILKGQFQGELRSVEFVATSPGETMQWFVINCGQLEQAFRTFLPRPEAKEIMETLRRGRSVRFPGRYRRDLFDGGFHYQWSPVAHCSPLSFLQVWERDAGVCA